jgi:hypothetical protein
VCVCVRACMRVCVFVSFRQVDIHAIIITDAAASALI